MSTINQTRKGKKKKKKGKHSGLIYKFKTQICKHWAAKHQCIYGEKCLFAHGSEELLEDKSDKGTIPDEVCSYTYFLSSLSSSSKYALSEVDQTLLINNRFKRLEVFKQITDENLTAK